MVANLKLYRDGIGSSEDAEATPGSKQARALFLQKTILDYAEQELPEPIGSQAAASKQNPRRKISVL